MNKAMILTRKIMWLAGIGLLVFMAIDDPIGFGKVVLSVLVALAFTWCAFCVVARVDNND